MPIQQGGTFTPSNRIVSAGVFTRENDQSFLAQGVESIGGAIVGPFSKGPGFTPTLIRSQGDLEALFGAPDGKLYTPFTAQEYLKEQGVVTVVRVGGLAGYNQKNPIVLSAIPGQYDRFTESGSISGSVVNASFTSGSNVLVGSLIGTFYSGIYSGSQVQVGTISSSLTGVQFSSSVFVSGTLNSAIVLNPQIGHIGTLTVSGKVTTENLCGNVVYYVSGSVTGDYGSFDIDSWVPEGLPTLDACGNIVSGSGRNEVVLAVLANTAFDTGQNLYGFSGSTLVPSTTSSITSNYSINLVESHLDSETNEVVSSSYGSYSFSIDPESPSYLKNVFGVDPSAGFVPVSSTTKKQVAYVYKNFEYITKEILSEMVNDGSWKIELTTGGTTTTDFEDGITPDIGDSTFDLTNAYTPWINSQIVSRDGGIDTKYNLFKVHTLSDGTPSNTEYKIEISNVKLAGTVPGSEYGSFTLSVRQYSDTDVKPVYVESFANLNLNPDSADFIARRIGDRYTYIDHNGKILEFGDYTNQSKTIRVEMTTVPYPVSSVPFGFDPYASPIGGDFSTLSKLTKMTYTNASTYSSQPGKYASGVVFQPAPGTADAELSSLYPQGSAKGSELDNKQFFAPIPRYASSACNDFFDLENNAGLSPVYSPATEQTSVKKRKFVLGFQGGFDGQSPSVPVLIGNDIISTNQQGLNCSTNTSLGSYAYSQALAALSNADEFDINLIALPGINYAYNPYIVTKTVELCEERGDVFYIMDVSQNLPAGQASIDTVSRLAEQFDTNYAATYYPWIKIVDTNTNKIIPVPPSVVLPSVYASNDRVGAEWFAPAGLNRGGIPTAVQVADRLTHANRDDLYQSRVNPIAAFAGQGINVWGQKTLQVKPSALDRINVRRLLISLKKFIASSSKYLVFEQNTAVTRNKFLNLVNPYLQSVQQRSGLYAFRVVMDDTNNTADLVDRNILYGQIYIQPTKTSEFVIIDFNVMPTGASFSNG